MTQNRVRVIRDIKNFLNNNKKIVTKQKEQVTFIAIVILNMKVMVLEIKPYQSKNILIKLNYT